MAGVLVLLALASYTTATWVYLGRLGVVSGTFMPGGVVKNFNVSMGVLYAGEIKTVKTYSVVHVPEDVDAVIYVVPYINATNMTFSYRVQVFDNDIYVGSLDNYSNLTLTLTRGMHNLSFIITVEAPVNITRPTPFSLELYISTG